MIKKLICLVLLITVVTLSGCTKRSEDWTLIDCSAVSENETACTEGLDCRKYCSRWEFNEKTITSESIDLTEEGKEVTVPLSTNYCKFEDMKAGFCSGGCSSNIECSVLETLSNGEKIDQRLLCKCIYVECTDYTRLCSSLRTVIYDTNLIQAGAMTPDIVWKHAHTPIGGN